MCIFPKSLGEEDSIQTTKGKQVGKGLAGKSQDSSPKANSTWASLFHSNRELSDDLILSDWVDDNTDTNLDFEDIDVVEEAWGFGLIGYVAGKFPAKGQ